MVEKLLIHRDFKRPRNRTQDTNKVMGVGGDPPPISHRASVSPGLGRKQFSGSEDAKPHPSSHTLTSV